MPKLTPRKSAALALTLVAALFATVMQIGTPSADARPSAKSLEQPSRSIDVRPPSDQAQELTIVSPQLDLEAAAAQDSPLLHILLTVVADVNDCPQDWEAALAVDNNPGIGNWDKIVVWPGDEVTYCANYYNSGDASAFNVRVHAEEDPLGDSTDSRYTAELLPGIANQASFSYQRVAPNEPEWLLAIIQGTTTPDGTAPAPTAAATDRAGTIPIGLEIAMTVVADQSDCPSNWDETSDFDFNPGTSPYDTIEAAVDTEVWYCLNLINSGGVAAYGVEVIADRSPDFDAPGFYGPGCNAEGCGPFEVNEQWDYSYSVEVASEPETLSASVSGANLFSFIGVVPGTEDFAGTVSANQDAYANFATEQTSNGDGTFTVTGSVDWDYAHGCEYGTIAETPPNSGAWTFTIESEEVEGEFCTFAGGTDTLEWTIGSYAPGTYSITINGNVHEFTVAGCVVTIAPGTHIQYWHDTSEIMTPGADGIALLMGGFEVTGPQGIATDGTVSASWDYANSGPVTTFDTYPVPGYLDADGTTKAPWAATATTDNSVTYGFADATEELVTFGLDLDAAGTKWILTSSFLGGYANAPTGGFGSLTDLFVSYDHPVCGQASSSVPIEIVEYDSSLSEPVQLADYAFVGATGAFSTDSIELSAMTFNDDTNRVLMMDNTGVQLIHEFDVAADGTISTSPRRTIDVSALGTDLEGLAWIDGTEYAVVDEDTGEIHRFSIADGTADVAIGEDEVTATISTSIVEDGGRGAEGLAYRDGMFYVVDEGPTRLYRFSADGSPQGSVSIDMSDLSGVYAAIDGTFYVLSHEDKRVAHVEVDTNWTTATEISSLTLSGADLQQAEGLAMPSSLSSLYVVGETETLGGNSYGHWQQ